MPVELTGSYTSSKDEASVLGTCGVVPLEEDCLVSFRVSGRWRGVDTNVFCV